MKLRHIITASAIVVATGSGAFAQTFDNPMTRAVMNTYEQLLRENPKDYQVYFRRAGEYYNHRIYDKALTDIDLAIRYASSKDTGTLFQCYAMRSSILEALGKRDEAISAISKALEIDPNNYSMINQRANMEYAAGKYQEAKADYQKLQRLNSRSPEALFGLAAIAAAEGNTAQANLYSDDALSLSPTGPEAYIRHGEIRAMMGNNQGAIDDYVMALSLSKDNSIARPLQLISDMSETDYRAVINGLSSAISKAPSQSSIYFLRARIARDHGHYASAVTDYEYLINSNLVDPVALYRPLAECYYALGKYELALDNIDNAIGMSADNVAAYAVKSDIKCAMKAYNQAITAADRAIAKDANYAPALAAKGIAQVCNKFYAEASNNIGNAMLASPKAPWYKMLRAWVLTDYLEQPDVAADIYRDVINLPGYADDDVTSLRGFAMLYTGDTEGGNAWMQKVLDHAATVADGEAQYYGACYYAAAGDLDKAFACMENSLKNGYADYHNWTDNSVARINVAALRGDARFDRLMNQYSFLFQVTK